MNAAAILASAAGYDRVAANYDTWKWSRFWDAYEAPLVRQLLAATRPKSLLDAGCGTGRYRADVERLGCTYVGLDSSMGMVKAHHARHGRDTRTAIVGQGDVRALPFQPAFFDFVLVNRVLSNVTEAGRAVAEFARVLRPGGLLALTDVHTDHPYDVTRLPTCDGWVHIETHKHALADLRSAAIAAGLVPEASREFWLADLDPPPPPAEFAKLYQHPERPIWYYLSFSKRSGISA